jgi:4-hydroxybenzoate polyprenyltransferase
MNRWIVYQRERFPLAGHVPLIAAFSGSAVCFSRLVRGESGLPPASSLLVAFTTALIFFLQLRIADEFKDFEDDSRFRPYRPVPRGLVTLRELAGIGAAGAVVQLALAVWYQPPLVALLAMAWAYLAVMSREFFVPDWLKARPVLYMASHLVIIPLIDLYATACDWVTIGRWPPDGLIWFLLVSYTNGLVVEIGRKLRAPVDEETGVETYSALWGVRRALHVWLAAIIVTAIFAWQAARQIDAERMVAGLLVVLISGCGAAAIALARRPAAGRGKVIEIAAGVWTLLMYLSLGLGPAVLRWAGWT